MTKIVVDKQTALKAVCELFHIPYFDNKRIIPNGEQDIRISAGYIMEFDFEKKEIDKE